MLPSSDSCEDRRSACSLLGIASLRTGEKMDGTHCCVAFFCVMWTSSSFGEQRGALLSTGCPALPCLALPCLTFPLGVQCTTGLEGSDAGRQPGGRGASEDVPFSSVS